MNLIKKKTRGGGLLLLALLAVIVLPFSAYGADQATLKPKGDNINVGDKGFDVSSNEIENFDSSNPPNELVIDLTNDATLSQTVKSGAFQIISYDEETGEDKEFSVTVIVKGAGTLKTKSGRHFIVGQGNNLELNGVTIAGSAGNGGIEIAGGNASFDRVIFTGNSSATNGGAVSVTDGNVVFKNNATFEGNEATGDGGAVYVTRGNVTFEDATFEGNKATKKGGAVYISGGKVTFDGTVNFGDTTPSDLKRNKADGDGGALYIANATDVTVTDGTLNFLGNDADGSGGALYIGAGTMTFGKAPVFGPETVTASVTGNDSKQLGGAVYLASGAALQLPDALTTNFNANTAQSGGALYLDSGAKFTGKANFEGNSVNNDGGAVYLDSDASFTGNSSFTNNSAKTNGGALFMASNTSFTGSSSFENNSANNNGGALYLASGAKLTGSSSFTSNSADKDGGALYMASGASFTESSGFQGNSAKAQGGAIYSSGSFEVPANTNFGTTTTPNTAAQGGAIAVAGAATIDFKGESKLQGNSATSATNGGGAIYSDGAITIKGTPNFDSNTTSGSGGAIHAVTSITLEDSPTFNKNVASNDGGALYTPGAVQLKTGATFTGNKVDGDKTKRQNGGAIYTGTSLNVTGTSGVFTGNTALNGDGGAIYSAGAVSVTGATFGDPDDNSSLPQSLNEAGWNGGAIYAGGSITAKNSNFYYQKAGISGGALYSVKEADIDDCTFQGNITTGTRASNGGAVYIYGGTESKIQDSQFSSNEAARSALNPAGGGAAYVRGGDLTVKQSTFDGNKSSASGGAIRVDNGAADIDLSYFYNNRMSEVTSGGGGGGGALAVLGSLSSLLLKDSRFDENVATGNGGAVYAGMKPLNAKADATILRSTFIGNLSIYSDGGAIFSSAYGLSVANCTFNTNRAPSGSGGAIASESVNSSLFFNTLIDNSADTGGASYSSSTSPSSFNMMANILLDNRGTTAGNDFYSGSPTSYIVNSLGYNYLKKDDLVYGEPGTSGLGNFQWDADKIGGTPAKDIQANYGVENVFITSKPEEFGDPVGQDLTKQLAIYRPDTEADGNPLLNKIARSDLQIYESYIRNDPLREVNDAFGNSRKDDAYTSIGAVHAYTGNPGDGEGNAGRDRIPVKIRISGVPNVIKTTGQNVILRVVGYNAAGDIVPPPINVNWHSSDPSVVSFSKDIPGRLTANGVGRATITARLVSNPSNVFDSVKVVVYEYGDYEDLNISPELWEYYTYTSSNTGVMVAEPDASILEGQSFSRAFNVAANQLSSADIGKESVISECSDSHSESGYKSETGVTVKVSKLQSGKGKVSQGDVLPIAITLTFTDGGSKDIATLLANQRIDFVTSAGKTLTLLRPDSVASQSSVQAATDGITVTQALNSGVLTRMEGSGSDATLLLRAYIANVKGVTSDAAQLIDANAKTGSLLVVPDGNDQDGIEGTIWMMSQSESSSNPSPNPGTGNTNNGDASDGGGGGGCSTGFGSLALLLAATVLLKRK